MNVTDKKIAIVGFGIEGFSSAMYLVKKDAKVTVLDEKKESELDTSLVDKAKDAGIVFHTGSDYLSDLGSFDIVVRSPGIKRLLPEFAKAAEQGVTITSQTQLFLENCKAPVIGVTGTKGKGTTASLIAEMLTKSGFDTHLGGNIGLPPFEFLDNLTETSRVVLELSSFQLQDVTLSPHIAVMLMVTSEHLDYHTDHTEYVEAKRNILKFQKPDDFAVINRDYPVSNESDIYTEGKVFQVSRERPSTEQGCFVKEDAIWISMEGSEWKVLNIKDIALLGKHNLENVCASVMAATLAGATKEDIKAVLTLFTGLEHRLELVATVKGVSFYNDSFSTTPETAIAAIESFENPEIIILGGSSKKSDFSELGSVIAKADNIKAIIGIGDEWMRIKESIEKESEGTETPILMIEGASDMKTVVQAASKIAHPGDVVLLSPACASFGMFTDYKERGKQFKEEVNQLRN